jgi:hypothetical protein
MVKACLVLGWPQEHALAYTYTQCVCTCREMKHAQHSREMKHTQHTPAFGLHSSCCTTPALALSQHQQLPGQKFWPAKSKSYSGPVLVASEEARVLRARKLSSCFQENQERDVNATNIGNTAHNVILGRETRAWQVRLQLPLRGAPSPTPPFPYVQIIEPFSRWPDHMHVSRSQVMCI